MRHIVRILLVSDDGDDLPIAQRALAPHHLQWHVTTVTSAAAARAALASQPFDVIVADAHVVIGAGASLLDHARLLYPRTHRVPLQGATDLAQRIARVFDAQAAQAPSSLHEAFARLSHAP